MINYPRFTINRHLIILMPKQPVLDWIKRVDPNPPDITLEELHLEQNAFLVPDVLDGQQDAEKWVQRRWQMFFEGFLEEWYTVESWWPQGWRLQASTDDLMVSHVLSGVQRGKGNHGSAASTASVLA